MYFNILTTSTAEQGFNFWGQLNTNDKSMLKVFI